MKEVCPKYGIRLEEQMFAKGLDIVPGILAGEIDLAASALDGAIAGRASGAPVFVVAGFAKGGARILAGKESGITKLADLKGKKVGTARGGAQELLLYAELAKAKLTWSDQAGKDVRIVFLAYADLNQALMSGQLTRSARASRSRRRRCARATRWSWSSRTTLPSASRCARWC
jgi:NitT/TauT family transport system substrate-binding protein